MTIALERKARKQKETGRRRGGGKCFSLQDLLVETESLAHAFRQAKHMKCARYRSPLARLLARTCGRSGEHSQHRGDHRLRAYYSQLNVLGKKKKFRTRNRVDRAIAWK